MEIERKFLINELPEHLEQFQKKEIIQAYLCKSPTLRIRKSNEDYILTYKSKIGLERADTKKASRICNEVEVPLTKEAFEHLMTKIDGNVIHKTRYLIPLTDRLTVELDVFSGMLAGLYFAEVEFESEEEAEGFVPPSWFTKDVTEDKRFSNSRLSLCQSIKELGLL